MFKYTHDMYSGVGCLRIHMYSGVECLSIHMYSRVGCVFFNILFS